VSKNALRIALQAGEFPGRQYISFQPLSVFKPCTALCGACYNFKKLCLNLTTAISTTGENTLRRYLTNKRPLMIENVEVRLLDYLACIY